MATAGTLRPGDRVNAFPFGQHTVDHVHPLRSGTVRVDFDDAIVLHAAADYPITVLEGDDQ